MDQLRIEARVLQANDLEIKLEVLTKSPFLWSVVSEERTDGVQLHRLW